MQSRRRLSHGENSQARRPHFFKVILQRSIFAGKLEIPVEFVRKFGEELHDVAVLKVPGGGEWFIELKNIDGAVWFHNCWQGFLEHYNISAGHFLVFRYDGNSHFFVLIFNETACEIEYPPNVNPPGESNLQNKGLMPGSEERRAGVLFSLRKRPATTCEVELTSKTSRLSRKKKKKNKDQREMEELPHRCELNQVKKERSTEGEDIFCVEHIGLSLSERTRRPTTTEDREKAKRLAQMLKTKKPSFMVMMKPSYLCKGLNVPLVFAREHFTEGAHNVTLQLREGRTWSVQFYFNYKIKALLSGGWKTFVQENMLEDGDCCVFELLKVEEIEFKVSIFRVVEKVVQPGCYVKARRKKRKMIENKATQEARNFKSGNPFFEVYMYPSYAQGSYMIMRHSFFKRHLTDNLQRVVLQDADGRKWPIRCIINHDNCRFGSGWAKFAKKNNIKEGDVCVFELIKRNETLLKVSIFKSH
ncbi:hypothetical protein NE237_017757 [Protea cynaroides]|uniref:TF-B3 domain-containing protein n=1 Tax=Protea cynaroides TaxID=273540 RepID=A0A9Q0QND4_9MAGN|nr:hypothetical protein NE237_017757 [Protea cynaroides]